MKRLKSKRLRSQRGQAVFESVLMMVVVLVIWTTVTSSLKKAGFFQKVFGSSWTRLSNTMEFGIPTAQRGQAASLHPTSFDRHSSVLHE